MFNGGNLRNRLRVTKRTNPIHSIASSGRGVKQSIPILFPLVSSNDVPIGGIYLYTDDLYEDFQREGDFSYEKIKPEWRQGKAPVLLAWASTLCSLSPPINHFWIPGKIRCAESRLVKDHWITAPWAWAITIGITEYVYASINVVTIFL